MAKFAGGGQGSGPYRYGIRPETFSEEVLCSLLFSDRFSDVMFVAGAHRFPAHRNIVTSKAPHMLEMLSGEPGRWRETAEGGAEVSFTQSADAVACLLVFMYTGKLLSPNESAVRAVGDIVCRGPGWSDGSDDTRSGKRYPGVVTRVEKGLLRVSWRTNPDDQSSQFSSSDHRPDQLSYVSKVMTAPLICEMIDLAAQNEMDSLKQICEERAKQTISKESVLAFFEVSDLHNLRGLYEACVEFVRANTAVAVTITVSGAFRELEARNKTLWKRIIASIGAELEDSPGRD